MAGKKPKQQKPGEVPEYVQNARVMQRRKVSKRKLPSYTEAMMLLHAPEAQRMFWKALLEGMGRGDKDFVRMTGEIFELLKKGGGINIVQGLLQQNVAAGAQSPVMGFDAFARQLAETRAGHVLAAPADVIDIHPVDTPISVEV